LDIRAICLVRNEEDIWEQNLHRLVDIFDHVYVVDQNSTDRTPSITRNVQTRSPSAISTYSILQRGYFQSEVSKLFADRAFSQGADWVLFVDADEFINVTDRSQLESTLIGHETEIVHYRWRNLLPSKLGSYGSFEVAQSYRTLRQPSDYVKVAIPAAWAARFPQFEVELGNHAVLPWDGAKPVSGPGVGEYFHIPVRSLERLSMKVETGIAAYEAKSGNRSNAGDHWYEIRKLLADGSDQKAALTNMILDYGKLGAHWLTAPEQRETVEERSFIDGRVPVMGVEQKIGSTSFAVRSLDDEVKWHPSPITKGKRVASLSGSTIQVGLQPVSGRGSTRRRTFGTLPANAGIHIEHGALVEAVCAAFERIETPVATAWGGHVPTMFFLMNLLAPRRYAELGSHHGMSFFAACQIAKGMAEPCECVGIDTWEGDSHTKSYDETVFEDFRYLLKTHYPHVGHFVRGYFDDAARCFEDNSIDLLHIDGLHTYEAVKRDFETWLPKMTDRGVIMFHDTTEYEGDFGVWRLWREVEEKYPSWNSLHTHGLGIAYVGNPDSDVARLLNRLREDPSWSEAANEVAKGVGNLSFANAVHAVSHPDRSESTVNLRGRVSRAKLNMEKKMAAAAATKRTSEKFRSSLSWRVTAPLRFAGRLVRFKGR
jgi:hypothetical protein